MVIHPDFEKLLDRYKTDARFEKKEPDRQKCISCLIQLNNWVQKVKMPPEIKAVLLTGSFSSLKKEPPNLDPVINGPWFQGVREGGSDMDVLFLYSSSIAGLLKLKWWDFNIPERELVHPDDFVVNAIGSLKAQLHRDCSEDLVNRVEIHVAVLTSTLGKIALKGYVRRMIQTGTLICGNLKMADYGKYRNKPPTIKRLTSDPVLDRMAGGF